MEISIITNGEIEQKPVFLLEFQGIAHVTFYATIIQEHGMDFLKMNAYIYILNRDNMFITAILFHYALHNLYLLFGYLFGKLRGFLLLA